MRRLLTVAVATVVVWTLPAAGTRAQESAAETQEPGAGEVVATEQVSDAMTWSEWPDAETWVDRERLRQVLPTVGAFALLGVAPIVVLMTTGFLRISIVLALLRQAFGTTQIPSNQVLTAVSFMLTVVLMAPVWTEVYERVSEVSSAEGERPGTVELFQQAQQPVRRFMIRQLNATQSSEEIWLFWRHASGSAAPPESYEQVPLRVLLPAFVLSELKTAFLIGFQVFLPFLVVDLLVSTMTLSMGMSSLPSQTVALPLKLMFFVIADGWHLVVDLLLRSFAA